MFRAGIRNFFYILYEKSMLNRSMGFFLFCFVLRKALHLLQWQTQINRQRGMLQTSELQIRLFLQAKSIDIFLFFHKNIHCGYFLEVPDQGVSNEHPQHMFLWRNTILALNIGTS